MDSDLALNLLNTHPNEFAISPSLNLPQNWFDLIRLYNGHSANNAVPADVEDLISTIRRLQLPRSAISMKTLFLPSEQGMSPKKVHEVVRMSTYVVQLAKHISASESRIHIVDVGAGQGYLTRTLKAHLPSAKILALDADSAQTRAAQRWEEKILSDTVPPIHHEVIYISPENLITTIDKWVAQNSQTAGAVPVILIGLHACGSLTPNILRAFVGARSKKGQWYPAGLVTVGCCYNLMDAADHPASLQHVPVAAYQLAAQVPSEWLLPTSPPTLGPSASLSIRKVVYHALLEKALQNSISAPQDEIGLNTSKGNSNASATVPARWYRSEIYGRTENNKGISSNSPDGHIARLGRLRDSAYTSWDTFLRIAEQRMKVRFHPDEFDPEDKDSTCISDDQEPRSKLSNEALSDSLSSLHVLRCLLGPLIETMILQHRIDWVRNALASDGYCVEEDTTSGLLKSKPPLRAELVNLFDLSTGSGRNVAIVLAPSTFNFWNL